MSSSLTHAARILLAVMLGLLAICGATALWSVFSLSASVSAQADAAGLIRTHMRADMMHDAVRGDVLAALASRDPASGTSLAQTRKDLDEHLATLQSSLAAYRNYAAAPEVEQATSRLAEPMRGYGEAARRIVMTWDGRGTPDLSQFYARFGPAMARQACARSRATGRKPVGKALCLNIRALSQADSDPKTRNAQSLYERRIFTKFFLRYTVVFIFMVCAVLIACCGAAKHRGKE